MTDETKAGPDPGPNGVAKEVEEVQEVQEVEVNAVVGAFDWIASNDLRVIGVHLALGLLAYAIVLNGSLFFDDQQFIEQNQYVTNFEVAEIYTSSVTEGTGFQSNTYRPNQQLVFAVFYKFFGLTPFPYHLFSLIVHIANAFLVFLLLQALSLGRVGSFLGSLLFLVHPIQTQAVSYVSGLAGPLLLLFLLSGILLWIASLSQEDSGRRALLFACVIALFVGGFFTKSSIVIILPLAVLLAIYLVLTERVAVTRYLVLSVAGISLLAFGFLAIKLTLLNFAGTVGMVEGYNVYTDSLLVRMSTFISVLDRYVEMILWPASLSYGKPKVIYATLFTYHGAVGLIILAIGLLAAVRARTWPLVFLGVGWFFAALAPFSGLIPLTSMYLEHWLYIPLIGVTILIAGFYQSASLVNRNNLANVAIPILLILVTRTAVRNYDWADPERFYVADMRAVGPSVQMLNNLAIHYIKVEKVDLAIKALELVIETVDTAPEPHDNLAQIYARRGDYFAARSEFLKALEIDPYNRNALIGLRDLYDSRGKLKESLQIEQRIRTLERDEGL
ncbi:MAG: tetratricopeptide repeat protein [Deltaproteobacteria bacterium]|nr:tetratricopeptide repeat protein [Deltaproteobacteria bacterium]